VNANVFETEHREMHMMAMMRRQTAICPGTFQAAPRSQSPPPCAPRRASPVLARRRGLLCWPAIIATLLSHLHTVKSQSWAVLLLKSSEKTRSSVAGGDAAGTRSPSPNDSRAPAPSPPCGNVWPGPLDLLRSVVVDEAMENAPQSSSSALIFSLSAGRPSGSSPSSSGARPPMSRFAGALPFDVPV